MYDLKNKKQTTALNLIIVTGCILQYGVHGLSFMFYRYMFVCFCNVHFMFNKASHTIGENLNEFNLGGV